MKIAVFGTGRMGKAIAKTLFSVYSDGVFLAGRDREKTRATAKALGNIKTEEVDKVFEADIIIPALWYMDLRTWLTENKTRLKGKTVIDITNPFNERFDDFILPYDSSSAEELQMLVPETKIAGAFKNTYWVVFDSPVYNGLKSDIYVTCNDEVVRNEIIKILKPLPFRVFDAGKLKNNRTIERMTLLERELALKAGNHPRVSFHLWGVNE